MALTMPSMPSGWKAVVGTFGSDITLNQCSTTQFMANDKFLRLEDTTAGGTGSLVAPKIESALIPYREFYHAAGTAADYDVSVAFQVSSIAAGNTITMTLTFYDQAGSSIGTAYLRDQALTQLNGVVAVSTGKLYAGHSFNTGVASGASFMKLTIEKAATAFTLDIHGVHVRPAVASHVLAQDGAAVAVSDSAAAPAWTYLDIAPGSMNRMMDYYATTGASATAALGGKFLCHAVAKCEDVPSGSEFAIRLVQINSGGITASYEGQRIVSAAASKTWQISASALIDLVPHSHVRVQCQHIGSGASGDIDVELVHGYVVDCLPWQ